METHSVIVPERDRVVWSALFQPDGATRAEAWAKVELDSRLAEQAVHPARELPKHRILHAITRSCILILFDIAFVACMTFDILFRAIPPAALAALACSFLAEPAPTPPVTARHRRRLPAGGLRAAAAAVTAGIAFSLVTRESVLSVLGLAASRPARRADSTHALGAEHPEARNRAVASLLHLVSAHTNRQARAMSRRREARKGWLTALERAARPGSDSVRATQDPARARTFELAHHQLPAISGPGYARESRSLDSKPAQGFLSSPGPCGKLAPRAGSSAERLGVASGERKPSPGMRASAQESPGRHRTRVRPSLANAHTAGGLARPLAQRRPPPGCATSVPIAKLSDGSG
jgi:hypothetical protein